MERLEKTPKGRAHGDEIMEGEKEGRILETVLQPKHEALESLRKSMDPSGVDLEWERVRQKHSRASQAQASKAKHVATQRPWKEWRTTEPPNQRENSPQPSTRTLWICLFLCIHIHRDPVVMHYKSDHRRTAGCMREKQPPKRCGQLMKLWKESGAWGGLPGICNPWKTP